jgi:homoserine dehydrogenase
MQLALNAGDITAYSQLADLYKQAAEIEELKNPTATANAKALSASQSKALTAQQQLDALAQMKPDAGTVASNIPILSNIVDLTGGNEYASQADALATTLGYMLSGANIKKEELASIYKDYVPTAFDSEAVRQRKLNNARQLIQSYMSDTSAIAQ